MVKKRFDLEDLMGGILGKWRVLRIVCVMVIWSFMAASVLVAGERGLKEEGENVMYDDAASGGADGDESQKSLLHSVANFLWQPNLSGYQHVWPV